MERKVVYQRDKVVTAIKGEDGWRIEEHYATYATRKGLDRAIRELCDAGHVVLSRESVDQIEKKLIIDLDNIAISVEEDAAHD